MVQGKFVKSSWKSKVMQTSMSVFHMVRCSAFLCNSYWLVWKASELC